jgi:flagellin
MVINTNIAALTSANNLDQSTNQLNASLARLSSGSKIVNASDDPAGLAESMQLSEQIGEATAGNANVSNALAYSQTQDGYLQQVSAALNQMASLAISAQDPTKTTSELANYDAQYQALVKTVTSALGQSFNGTALFQAGNNFGVVAGNATTVTLGAVNTANGTNLKAALADTLTSTGNASTASSDVALAITDLATDRGTVGSNEEQLTYASNELGVLSTNLTAAKSQITDVDVAQESTNYAKQQILVQSGTAMLAQANTDPQSILKLLQ